MSVFQYQNQNLHAENVSLAQIASEHGTPCYVYSRKAFEDHYKQYADFLTAEEGLVCYAVKANSNIAVLNVLAKLGAGFDIVSIGELERVLKAGATADKIVFSGVAKQSDEMSRALELGIHCFNVESQAELELLNEVAQKLGKVAPVSFRVNPDVDAKTHPYISTGLKENKFGIDIKKVADVYQQASQMPGIAVKGIDCHIGSQIVDEQPFIDALDRVLLLVDQLAQMGISIEHLDLGGGIGVDYQGETPPNIGAYINKVKEIIAGRNLKLVFEPGRSIAANAGVLLTQVQFLKPGDFKNFAIIDAGMNDLIRPSLYQAWQNVLPIQQSSDAASKSWDLVGPICETGDFLAKDRELSLQQGDILSVMSAGAYGFVMASNYNSRNKVAEIMVDGDQSHVVRKRETYEQQFAGEACLPEVK